MIKKALLVCDMVNDFVQKGAPLEVPGAREIIPNIQREIERAKKEGIPIVYINDSHIPNDPEMSIWPLHAIKGTEGAKVVSELAPQDGDIVVEKTRYDAFYRTNLEEILLQLEVSELIITGVCTEICVHYTGASAIMRDFTVSVPEDCVAGLNEKTSSASLQMLNEVLQSK